MIPGVSDNSARNSHQDTKLQNLLPGNVLKEKLDIARKAMLAVSELYADPTEYQKVKDPGSGNPEYRKLPIVLEADENILTGITPTGVFSDTLEYRLLSSSQKRTAVAVAFSRRYEKGTADRGILRVIKKNFFYLEGFIKYTIGSISSGDRTEINKQYLAAFYDYLSEKESINTKIDVELEKKVISLIRDREPFQLIEKYQKFAQRVDGLSFLDYALLENNYGEDLVSTLLDSGDNELIRGIFRKALHKQNITRIREAEKKFTDLKKIKSLVSIKKGSDFIKLLVSANEVDDKTPQSTLSKIETDVFKIMKLQRKSEITPAKLTKKITSAVALSIEEVVAKEEINQASLIQLAKLLRDEPLLQKVYEWYPILDVLTKGYVMIGNAVLVNRIETYILKAFAKETALDMAPSHSMEKLKNLFASKDFGKKVWSNLGKQIDEQFVFDVVEDLVKYKLKEVNQVVKPKIKDDQMGRFQIYLSRLEGKLNLMDYAQFEKNYGKEFAEALLASENIELIRGVFQHNIHRMNIDEIKKMDGEYLIREELIAREFIAGELYKRYSENFFLYMKPGQILTKAEKKFNNPVFEKVIVPLARLQRKIDHTPEKLTKKIAKALVNSLRDMIENNNINLPAIGQIVGLVREESLLQDLFQNSQLLNVITAAALGDGRKELVDNIKHYFLRANVEVGDASMKPSHTVKQLKEILVSVEFGKKIISYLTDEIDKLYLIDQIDEVVVPVAKGLVEGALVNQIGGLWDLIIKSPKEYMYKLLTEWGVKSATFKLKNVIRNLYVD